LRALSLCACCRHYPGAAAGRSPRSCRPAVAAFPERVVGSACTSSFSRLARRSLALQPAHSRRHLYVTCYTEGFSHFVTSMTAPVASGWSGWPGGTCTHRKAPPCHGAHPLRALPMAQRSKIRTARFRSKTGTFRELHAYSTRAGRNLSAPFPMDLTRKNGPLPEKGKWMNLASGIGVSPETLYRQIAKRRG
jgi:hypothetical protein